MDKKVLVATIAVLAVLVIGIANAQLQPDFASRHQGSGMAGMMSGDTGSMAQMMGNMGDMRQMHETMEEYLRETNAPAELQEMHTGCDKMMGW